MRREELRFILDVLQDKQAQQADDLDWFSILGFLEINKISGYFLSKATELGISLPQCIQRKLSQILTVQTCRNEIMAKYIKGIADKLNDIKIRYVFLKGSVLSNANLKLNELAFSCFEMPVSERAKYAKQREDTFYKCGERTSNDIDVLIEQKDITAVTNVLKDMGFKQGYFDFKENRFVELSRQEILSRRMNRGETAPFILELSGEILPFIEVDINFSLDYLPGSNSEMLNEILSDTIMYAGRIKGGIRSLRMSDFFVHLIMHQYKESILYSMVQRNKDLEMYKLLDIYIFIKRGYIDLMGLLNVIKRYGLEREFYYVLSQLNAVFDDIDIEDYLNMIKPNDIAYIQEVINPASKRKYIWRNSVLERLSVFDKKVFLDDKKEGGSVNALI